MIIIPNPSPFLILKPCDTKQIDTKNYVITNQQNLHMVTPIKMSNLSAGWRDGIGCSYAANKCESKAEFRAETVECYCSIALGTVAIFFPLESPLTDESD
jgi:hypothetical protein